MEGQTFSPGPSPSRPPGLASVWEQGATLEKQESRRRGQSAGRCPCHMDCYPILPSPSGALSHLSHGPAPWLQVPETWPQILKQAGIGTGLRHTRGTKPARQAFLGDQSDLCKVSMLRVSNVALDRIIEDMPCTVTLRRVHGSAWLERSVRRGQHEVAPLLALPALVFQGKRAKEKRKAGMLAREKGCWS